MNTRAHEIFWRHVQRGAPTECWLWIGARFANGYGRVRLSTLRTSVAHRLAWRLTYGDVPTDRFVCHHCDVRSCCNPAHLFLGTAVDNVQDCIRKGRRAMLRGTAHPNARLTEDDVVAIRRRREDGEPLLGIALAFGITRSMVSLIAHRRAWSHL